MERLKGMMHPHAEEVVAEMERLRGECAGLRERNEELRKGLSEALEILKGKEPNAAVVEAKVKAPPVSVQNCGNCDNLDQGRCALNPPTVLPSGAMMWAKVQTSDWCSHWVIQT